MGTRSDKEDYKKEEICTRIFFEGSRVKEFVLLSIEVLGRYQLTVARKLFNVLTVSINGMYILI